MQSDMRQKSERNGHTHTKQPARIFAVLIVAVWVLSGLVAGAQLVPKRLQGAFIMSRLPVRSRQIGLLSVFTPIVRWLPDVADKLPPDSKVFMVNATISDYYLANYVLYPRRVFVDEPDRFIDGVHSEVVGRPLSAEKLADMGITHLLIVHPSRRSCRLVPMGEEGTQ